jgi:hypothetical protein
MPSIMESKKRLFLSLQVDSDRDQILGLNRQIDGSEIKIVGFSTIKYPPPLNSYAPFPMVRVEKGWLVSGREKESF